MEIVDRVEQEIQLGVAGLGYDWSIDSDSWCILTRLFG
jgi:hypothetical protein